MRKVLKNSVAICTIVSLVGFMACTKKIEEPASSEADEQLVKDENTMNSEVDVITRLSQSALYLEDLEGGKVSKTICATITHDVENKMVTLDFGDGCTDEAGVERKGILQVKYEEVFSIRTVDEITMENYEVMGYTFNGTIINSGFATNDKDQIFFSRALQNVSVTFADGSVFTVNAATQTVTITEGGETVDLYDNTYEVTGSSTGTTRAGIAFTSTIDSPITYKAICLTEGVIYPVSGTANIVATGYPDYTIDYGNGDCDKAITIIIGEQTYAFELI